MALKEAPQHPQGRLKAGGHTAGGQTIRGIGTSVGARFTVVSTGTWKVSVTGTHREQPKSVGTCTLTVRVTGTVTVCVTGQLTTFRVWPGVRNVTGVQSSVMFPTGISLDRLLFRRRRCLKPWSQQSPE